MLPLLVRGLNQSLFLIPVPSATRDELSLLIWPPTTTVLRFPAAHNPIKLFKILTQKFLVDIYKSVFQCLTKHLIQRYGLKLGLFPLWEAKEKRKLTVLNNQAIQAVVSLQAWLDPEAQTKSSDSFSINQQCLSLKWLHSQADHLPHTMASGSSRLISSLHLLVPSKYSPLASILHKNCGSDWVTWPLLNQSQCPGNGDHIPT